MALAILGCSATELLNGDFEQSATSYLMMTWIYCTPDAGAMSLAHRESEHTSAMLEGERSTGSASALVLAKSV